MTGTITSDHIMIFLLVLFLAMLAVSLYQQQRSSSSFNCFDLLMEGGILSHAKVFATGGWILHTWTVAFWTLQGTVKSEDFLVYSGIWVAPALVKIIKGGEAAPAKTTCGKEPAA
jgi:hypothetical protein